MASKWLLNRILVPIDGSSSSLMAEETAATIAKSTGASIIVFTAVQELRLAYQLPRSVETEILGRMEQESEKILSNARALFAEEGISMEVRGGRSSDPAESILELSLSCDLIVMGAHGENEKDPYALGSVTKKVVRLSTRPTLIAKRVSKLLNILVGIDGSEHSIKAFEYAVQLGEKIGSKFTLVNVQEPRIYDYAPKTAEELGYRILSTAVNAAGKENLQIDKKVQFGVPSDKIVQFAEKGNYDLIVMGSRGLGTVKRFLLGSVSDDVCHKAKCPVLIVPAKT